MGDAVLRHPHTRSYTISAKIYSPSKRLIWIRIPIQLKIRLWLRLRRLPPILLRRLLRLRRREVHHRDTVGQDRDQVRLNFQRTDPRRFPVDP
jgi:hypothetical protein